jgi:hypothetical protein
MVSKNPDDVSNVTPVNAASILAALKDNEPAIVEAFRTLSQGERNRLGGALCSLASVLCMESKFQPVLLAEPIKIPVTSLAEGLAIQEALFRFGCGYHHGSYPLAREVDNQCLLSGIFVSRKGVISVMPDSCEADRAYVRNDKRRAVSPEVVLAANSLDALLKGGIPSNA